MEVAPPLSPRGHNACAAGGASQDQNVLWPKAPAPGSASLGSGRGTPPDSAAEMRPAALGKRAAPSAPPAPALRTSASPSLLDTLALAATAASSEKDVKMPAPGQMGGGGSPAAVVPAEITEAVSRVDQAVEYVMSVSRVRALGAPLALIVSSLNVKRNVHPSHPRALPQRDPRPRRSCCSPPPGSSSPPGR